MSSEIVESSEIERPVTAPGSKPLRSQKEENYAQQRAFGYRQREAARRAGLNDYTGIFAKYERKPRVQRRITFLRGIDYTNEFFVEKRRQIEERLEVVAFGSLFEHIKVVDGRPVIDYDGLAQSDLGVTVSDLKIDKDSGRVVGIGRDNALGAIQQLRDMRGLKAPDHVKLSVAVETLSDEDLMKVINQPAQPLAAPNFDSED